MNAFATRSGRLLDYAVPAIFLLLGLLALTLFGYSGLGRSGSDFAFDMRYLHVAGEMWERLASPYDVEGFKAAMKSTLGIDSGSYAYPPNSAPLALLLSSGSIGMATALIGTINLAAIGFLVLFVHLGAERSDPGDPHAVRPILLIAAAVVIGNPFTAHVVWMGQTTLVSAALLYGCWLLADRRMDLAAGILLGFSAFKPQLAFLVGFWFLLDRRWLLIAAAALATVVASAWPLVANGLDGSWLAWAQTLREYQDTVYNIATFKHVFGLRSLLATLGIDVPSLMLAGLAAVIAVYRVRHRYDGIWLINPILIISFLFLYAHDYDLAPVAVIAGPLLIAARGRPGTLMLICLLACLVFFPQRIWERLDLEFMARTREMALGGILATYFAICRKSRQSAGRSAAPVLG